MTSQSKARPYLLIAALVLAAAVVAFAGLSFSRKAQTFQPIGFEAIDRGGSWQVESVAPGQSDLLPGDQILLINGQEYGQIADPDALVRRHTNSELVVVRNDELVTVSHTLPPLEIDFPYLILSLIGIAYLLIGIYTLLRDGAPAIVPVLSLVRHFGRLYIASPAPPYDLGWPDHLHYRRDGPHPRRSPDPASVRGLSPRRVAQEPRVSRLIPFFYLPSAFLLALQADLVFFERALAVWWQCAAGPGSPGQAGALSPGGFRVGGCGGSGLAAAGGSDQPEPHRQATWIAVGMAGGYLPFPGALRPALDLGCPVAPGDYLPRSAAISPWCP